MNPKIIKTKTGEVEIPPFIDQELFDEYLLTRKSLKCPNTKRALQMIIKKLISFESNRPGLANQALENANANGWKSVYLVNNEREITHEFGIPECGTIR